MQNYPKNVSTVIETLEQYHYSESVIKLTQRCFSELGTFLASNSEDQFSAELAREWCNTCVSKAYKKKYLSYIAKLEDVYNYGRILGSNLKIFRHLSLHYITEIDMFLEHMRMTVAPRTVWNLRKFCTHFCSFLQYNGVASISDINYRALDKYILFLRESSSKFFESNIATFLKYLAMKNHCKIGLYLYMHYIPSTTVVTMADLTEDARTFIESLKEESLFFPRDEFYNAVSEFIEQMRYHRYSEKAVIRALSYLNRFYLFLDMSDLGYDYRIIDTLISECGIKIFKTGSDQARRTLEMFEDYAQVGGLLPQHKWKRVPDRYDLLPSWCQNGLSLFLESKRKEYAADHTIANTRSIGLKFCEFLVTEGLSSFGELTPQIIKKFIRFDHHESLDGKSKYNTTVSDFLSHLYFRGILQIDLSISVPKCARDGAKIVKVLNEDDRKTIEEYCRNAKTPIQIRDAAIIMLGLSTGMRPVDVVALRSYDISLSEMIIRFTQQKTGVSHITNLNQESANAIIRYIRDVRPKSTGDNHIFFTTNAPYKPITKHAYYDALKRAGVSDANCLTLRKTFGTEQVKSGATVKEAAEALGHSGIESVHCYVALDDSRMSLCPLSLADTGLIMDTRRYIHV